jgi:hypothetical protein
MRRQRQPNLSTVLFDILCQFAEAAEKYDVFTAGEVCRVYMTYVPVQFQPVVLM